MDQVTSNWNLSSNFGVYVSRRPLAPRRSRCCSLHVECMQVVALHNCVLACHRSVSVRHGSKHTIWHSGGTVPVETVRRPVGTVAGHAKAVTWPPCLEGEDGIFLSPCRRILGRAFRFTNTNPPPLPRQSHSPFFLSHSTLSLCNCILVV
jgi:hypothetical protein